MYTSMCIGRWRRERVIKTKFGSRRLADSESRVAWPTWQQNVPRTLTLTSQGRHQRRRVDVNVAGSTSTSRTASSTPSRWRLPVRGSRHPTTGARAVLRTRTTMAPPGPRTTNERTNERTNARTPSSGRRARYPRTYITYLYHQTDTEPGTWNDVRTYVPSRWYEQRETTPSTTHRPRQTTTTTRKTEKPRHPPRHSDGTNPTSGTTRASKPRYGSDAVR
jgi:hypothetical protein